METLVTLLRVRQVETPPQIFVGIYVYRSEKCLEEEF